VGRCLQDGAERILPVFRRNSEVVKGVLEPNLGMIEPIYGPIFAFGLRRLTGFFF
jgi:hypothetical protein